MHGDASAPANTRWRNPSQPQYRPGGPAKTAYQPRQPCASTTWRAQYSLVNRTSRGAEHSVPPRVASASVPPRVASVSVPPRVAAASVPPRVAAASVPPRVASASVPPRVASASVLQACSPSKGHAQEATLDNNTPTASTQKVPGNLTLINHNRTLVGPKAKCPPSVSTQKPPSGEAAQPSTSSEGCVRLRKNSPGSPGGPRVTSAQVPQISGNVSDAAPGSVGTLPPCSKPPIHVPKFASSTAAPSPKTLPAAAPPKVLRSSKTKYTWVAASHKPNPTPRKVSPNVKKASGGLEKAKSPPNGNGAKTKRTSPHQKCLPKNRYKWKAQPSPGASSAPATWSQAVMARSSPRTPETKMSHAAGSSGIAAVRDSAYKVKSRTKLVRRRSTSRSPVEKKASPLAPLTMKSRYVLRRKSSPRVKSPVTVKRSSPRALLHLSKHRLRRLPPAKPQSPGVREGVSSSSSKSPSVSRVIKTRYRIVKKTSSPPLISSPFSLLSSPSPYWRYRALMLYRARQLSQLRRAQPHLRWKKSLRCIEGSIYQVSANRLSKTWSPGTASKSALKTGKADMSNVSPGSSYATRTATPKRDFASRAVQRSLAIIRQAQQKKAKKEYCMYYNRFGRCKRGDSCPYIHDPEKVAVCTMFLRGTCKLTDGTCPFSHKVSKDKMPVCSFFLKGICHKTDCPYSHVYVSRKAEVCQDFLKGYCPMGAKCKKKHTLLCPHYARTGSCPDGTKCKLQHRQRKKRADSQVPNPEHPPPSCKQRRRSKEDSGDQPPAEGADHVPGDEGRSGACRRLNSCPSFISLSSSPSSEATPTSSKLKPVEDSGKPLQIKPRL